MPVFLFASMYFKQSDFTAFLFSLSAARYSESVCSAFPLLFILLQRFIILPFLNILAANSLHLADIFVR